MLSSIQNHMMTPAFGQNFALYAESDESFANIPFEIFMLIFNFTDLTTLYTLKCTTHSFKHLIIDSLSTKKISHLFTSPFIVPVFLYGNLSTIMDINNSLRNSHFENRNFIQLMSEHGQIKALKMFLEDPAVYLPYFKVKAVRENHEQGYLRIAKYIIDYSNMASKYGANRAIKELRQPNHLEHINRVAKDRHNVYLEGDDNVTIKLASFYGDVEVVKIILEDENVDPAMNDNVAIKCAIEQGHEEVVRLLLEDSRVDLSPNDKVIIRARENGHTKIAQLLDTRTNSIKWKLKLIIPKCLSIIKNCSEPIISLVEDGYEFINRLIRSYMRKLAIYFIG